MRRLATTILPSAFVKISSKASVTSTSDPVNPRRSTFVLSDEQREDAGGAELRQPMHVDTLAIDRRLVNLEIAGMDDHAVRGLDRQRDAVRDAVGDAEKLDGEGADRDALARPHRDSAGAVASWSSSSSLDSTSASVNGVP